MGIPGLTTFINNRSDRYLEYYELHDTYLVIDGNSIGCQIYNLYAKCNCVFGGDYDKFAQCVSDFFDELSKCNVTPLVLIDGGCEDKKLHTVLSRTKEKVRAASSFFPTSQQSMKFFPLLNKLVLKEVLRKKNIRHVQCLFEADNDIAAVARILNCPVLSYDSDFYIYGTLYIPFDTLEPHIVKRSTKQGYVKRCKIYRVEYLLNSFKGLHQSMLPLAAILLGNDYVKHGTFKNFFRQLKLRGIGKKRYSHRHYKIEATFIWLSRCTLDKAIISILSRLRKPSRQRILNLIETNINGYTNASADILVPLGFSKEYAAQVTTHSINRIFKFDKDISNLTYIKETCNEGDDETSEDEEHSDELETLDTSNISESISSTALVNKLPTWFLNEFLMGRYPSYFMDLLTRRLYICPVQIEDYRYPSTVVISLKIISIIFTLLKSGLKDRRNVMRYIMRNNNNKIARHELEGPNDILSCAVPSLYNLREIPLIIRKEILNNTLAIKDSQCINELLPEWMLYIACMKYWTEYQELYRLHKCYAYSLFVSLLFNVIDSKIGKHRNMIYFQKKYDSIIQNTQKKRKANNYKPQYSMNVTLSEAYNDIDSDDCLLAAPFFISHFEMDKKLYSNPKKFNRTIVHAFADFQSCFYQTMNLNALLDYPYPQTKIANLFNGTLLYNFFSNFNTRNDIDIYINTVLQSSPSLLRLLYVLLLKVRPLFPQLCQNEVNFQRKPVIRRKHVKSDKNEIDSDAEYFSADESLQESSFYDANNPFSMLNFTQ